MRDTDRNIDGLRDFLWTHQLNVAIFIIVHLQAKTFPYYTSPIAIWWTDVELASKLMQTRH